MMPWLLAARSLTGHPKGQLTWLQLWQVIRWYAHNRGYDGNCRWSGNLDEESSEDTQKEKNANALMQKHQTKTMAETICAVLEVDMDNDKPQLRKYFKGENVAFPRRVVVNEVRRILENHTNTLAGCDRDFIALLLDDVPESERKIFRLPQRYSGGLLFGQMIPRFDNRIIGKCPISGDKLPLKHCQEYYRFRWAMLMANMKVMDSETQISRPLTPQERRTLNCEMEAAGRMTPTQVRNKLEDITQASAASIDSQFFTVEGDDALELNPVKRVINRNFPKFWNALPLKWQKQFAGQIFKFKKCQLQQLIDKLEGCDAWTEDLARAVEVDYEEAISRVRKNKPTYENWLQKIETIGISGRAPYSRAVMRKAYNEAMQGMHPAAIAEHQPKGIQAINGCLVRTQEILDKEAEVPLDQRSNNHLVRQRIRIFLRLLEDMIKNFANGDLGQIGDITLEVARDMREYSGKNAKEKAAAFTAKTKPFNDASKKLEEMFKEVGITKMPTYSMIKKARIAIAHNWECPFTGVKISPADIAYDRVDFEHIIPKSKRTTDALDALVVTFREVNKRKGNRTALQFIKEDQGQAVSIPGASTSQNVEIRTERHFLSFVDALKPKYNPRSLSNASDEDRIRWKRKEWLRIEHYNERDADFTPRDLTTTSYLNKIAAIEARRYIRDKRIACGLERNQSPEDRIRHMQGSITHYFRTHWRLLDCLGSVVPEVVERIGHDSRLLPKAEIRNITHLHHAVDAIAIGFARACVPNQDKATCEAILRRRVHSEDRLLLERLGIFQFGTDGKHILRELPEEILKTVMDALNEKRVVQHVPRCMSGLGIELTQWGVEGLNDQTGRVMLRQYGGRDAKTNKRVRKHEQANPGRLLGYTPEGDSKLKPRKAAIIVSTNYGIALIPKSPTVIPFHNVWKRLKSIEQETGVRPPVLRLGDVIDIPESMANKYGGKWRIHSVKDNASGVSVDMAQPHLVKAENKKDGCRMNVKVKSLIKEGMTILETDLTG